RQLPTLWVGNRESRMTSRVGEKKGQRQCHGGERWRRHQQAGQRGGKNLQRWQCAAFDGIRGSRPGHAHRFFAGGCRSVVDPSGARSRGRVGEQMLSFPEVMQRYFRDTEGEIWGRGFFKVPRDDNVPLGYPSPFWEIGLGAAEVEVDSETGEVKNLHYVSLTDAGKMIHPIQCHAQDEGAAVFGIGQALFEDLVYQDGQLINGSLVDYRLPRFDDLPESFTTFIMEGGGGPGPYRAKGMGEGGILAVAPAVANAVHN